MVGGCFASYNPVVMKIAVPDHPVHELIARRWSPYGFSSRAIPEDSLRALFEAARWAASSFNEQPWRFLVARRDRADDFERVLGCLMEGNQTWGRAAPVLGLACVRNTFSRNAKPNRVAQHDLGLAVANLTFEATERGLFVHQMAGILPEKAREAFAIPEEFEAVTGFAVGYLAEAADPALRERDEKPRMRRTLDEIVFGAAWGEPGL